MTLGQEKRWSLFGHAKQLARLSTTHNRSHQTSRAWNTKNFNELYKSSSVSLNLSTKQNKQTGPDLERNSPWRISSCTDAYCLKNTTRSQLFDCSPRLKPNNKPLHTANFQSVSCF